MTRPVSEKEVSDYLEAATGLLTDKQKGDIARIPRLVWIRAAKGHIAHYAQVQHLKEELRKATEGSVNE